MSKRYSLKIEQDENAESPRTAHDNIGTMVCAHDRYTLGDIQESTDSDVLEYIAKDLGVDTEDWENGDMNDEQLFDAITKEAFITPVSLYDHSGITMSTGISQGWDSGQVGFIYVGKENLSKTHGIDQAYLDSHAEWTAGRTLEKVAEDILEGEVETYDTYLTGEVYGFTLETLNEDGEVVDEDSCWGFYGDNIEENGILDHLPNELRVLVEANSLTCYTYDEPVEFLVDDGTLDITPEIKNEIVRRLVESDEKKISESIRDFNDHSLLHSILSGETQIYPKMSISDLVSSYEETFGEKIEDAPWVKEIANATSDSEIDNMTKEERAAAVSKLGGVEQVQTLQ